MGNIFIVSSSFGLRRFERENVCFILEIALSQLWQKKTSSNANNSRRRRRISSSSGCSNDLIKRSLNGKNVVFFENCPGHTNQMPFDAPHRKCTWLYFTFRFSVLMMLYNVVDVCLFVLFVSLIFFLFMFIEFLCTFGFFFQYCLRVFSFFLRLLVQVLIVSK